MELSEVYIIDAGWIFLTAWGVILLGISLMAFGRDLLPSAKQDRSELRRR